MTGFFKVLWRVNAVLAFVALVAALAFIGWMSKDRITPLIATFAPAAAAQGVDETPKPKPAHRYMMEQDMVVGASTDSADFELFRLVRWGKIEGHPSTGDAAAIVNILVVDKKTNSNKWLFKGFDRAIIAQEPMLTGRWYYHEPQVDDDIPLHLIVLKAIDADTNGDGLLTTDDRQSLYVCRFEGGDPELILSADQIWETRQKGKEYFVSYREHGQGFFATYSLPDFKLEAKTAIADLPK